MSGNIQLFAEIVTGAQSIAVLTGAGISTASGIPDFRSAGGIYSDQNNVNVFDMDAFRRDPSIFYNFARAFYPQIAAAEPNDAHLVLAEWQRRGKYVTVITQNVDDFHQRAGSNPVYTVHGNYIMSTCLSCRTRIQSETILPIIGNGEIPHCGCGGVFKPDITFFGEMLPEDEWTDSVRAISLADLLLVLGTSLVVYPAAGLPAYRPRDARLVIVNRDPTPLDRQADIVIHDDLPAVMRAVDGLLD